MRRDALIQEQVADLRLLGRHPDRLADRGGEVLVIAEFAERRIGLVPLRLIGQLAILVGGVEMADDGRIDAADMPSSISFDMMCSGSLLCVEITMKSGSSRAPNEVSSTS